MQVTPAKLAEIALATMAEATVKANDETLALVGAARQFLRNIIAGKLIVMNANQEPAEPPVTARGSEGVVPAGKLR